MKFQPNPRQVLYLLKLLVTDGGVPLGQIKPPLAKTAERNELEKNGFIERSTERKKTPKGGAATYVTVSDKGWSWANENLGAEIARSYEAATVLQQFLSQLKNYLDNNEINLAALFMPRISSETLPPSDTVVEAIQPENMEKLIRETYCQLSGGKWNSRVRLCDLRQALPTFSRPDVDNTLLSMEDEKKLVLYNLDDPQEITAADTAAALEVVPGIERHIIYMKG